MNFLTFMVVSIPIIVITSLLIKIIMYQKKISIDQIYTWPYISTPSTYDENTFNDTISKVSKKCKLKILEQTSNSVLLKEPFLLWKRPGMFYCIKLSDDRKSLTLYYRSILYGESNSIKTAQIMLKHFSNKI